ATIDAQEIGLFPLMVEHQQFSRDNRRCSGAVGVVRQWELSFPYRIAVQVVTQQPVRSEGNVDPLSVRRRRGASRAADLMDLFDLIHGHRPSPQDIAGTPIDAGRGEVLTRSIELGQKDSARPNDWRRQSWPNSGLPLHVLAG